jgi:hypothetical protein
MHGEQRVWLESSVIKIADGTFINANEVEFIRMFSRKLLGLLIGEQLPNKQRKGKYFLFGKWYAVDALARIEQEVKNSFTKKDFETKLALEELLTYAKADFIIQSGEFIENGRGAKSIMTVLIQESCQKRNRSESLLLEWAKTKEGQESTMFDRQVKSFSDYSGFLTDLVNFLSDLIYSCPKADVQFKARVAKWKAVKNLLPIVLKKAHVKGEQINEIEFLKYLKERYLDSIIIDEITPQVIVPLLTEYIKHTHA